MLEFDDTGRFLWKAMEYSSAHRTVCSYEEVGHEHIFVCPER